MRGFYLFSRLYGTGKDRGAVAIITAIALIVVLPGFAALAVDVGRYMSERQQLQHALDAAALAGAQFLPFNDVEAETAARTFALQNDPDLQGVPVEVSFGCFVKAAPEDPGRPARTEVIALCRQFEEATFNCPGNGRCFLPCNFEVEGSSCNAIRVRAKISVPFMLARVLNGNPLTALEADLEGNACRGNCGTPPALNLALIIDRSSSIAGDYERVQAGAISVLRSDFVPDLHQVALGAIPNCSDVEFANGECTLLTADFIKEPLTNEYARLENVIENLSQGGSITDIGSAIEEASALLQEDAIARPEQVNSYIILLTDGIPSSLRGLNDDCQRAIDQAEAAESNAIRVFTIGYGLRDGDRCTPFDFGGVSAAELLQAMSTGGDNSGPPLNDCALENQDDDDFLCQNEGEDLTEIFNQIIQAIFNELAGSSLVDLSAHQL